MTPTHHWKKLSEIVAGDYIHRWGDDLEVLGIEAKNKGFILTVKDTDGKVKVWKYPKDGEYIVKG